MHTYSSEKSLNMGHCVSGEECGLWASCFQVRVPDIYLLTIEITTFLYIQSVNRKQLLAGGCGWGWGCYTVIVDYLEM
jgi:hypothetical protein